MYFYANYEVKVKVKVGHYDSEYEWFTDTLPKLRTAA
jgi:hypothetical protein